VGAEMHPLNGPGYCFMNILPIFYALFYEKSFSKTGLALVFLLDVHCSSCSVQMELRLNVKFGANAYWFYIE
jgi:hypothetical protein